MGRVEQFLRRGLPLGVVAGGALGHLADPSVAALDATAAVMSAGAVWLALGAVVRFARGPDRDRLVEDAARDHFDEHGRWPHPHEYRHFRRHGRWRP